MARCRTVRPRLTALTVASAAVLACLAGCGQMEKKREGAPQWVERPEPSWERMDYVSAVGAAEPGDDRQPDEAQAELRARAQLSHAVRGYVRRALTEFVQSEDEYGPPSEPAWQDFIRLVAAEVAASTLRREVDYQAWRDPGDGTLYVLCRVRAEQVHEAVRREAEEMLTEVNPFGGQEEKGLDRLGQYLESRLKEPEKEPEVPETEEQKPEQADVAPPDWLTGGSHPDYPSDKYLTAVGLADDPGAAQEAAHREVAALIDGRVARRFRAAAESGAGTPLSLNVSRLERETVQFTEADLVHCAVVAKWHDPVTETGYALAALERARAGQTYRNRVKSMFSEAVELAASASRDRGAGNYRDSVEGYARAVESAQRAVKFQLAGMAVRPEEADQWKKLIDRPVLAEAKSAVAELLGRLAFAKVSGDRQWTAPGMGLEEPLKVSLQTDEGRLLADWPVEFAFVRGEGELQAAEVTNQAGVAACTVTAVESSPQPTVMVRARLALRRITGEADLSGLEGPAADFVCVLRSKSNSFFALYVDERLPGGQPATRSVVADELRSAMTGAGFNLLGPEEVREQASRHGLRGDAAPEQVLEALAPLREEVRGKGFLLVVVADAEAELVDTVDTSQGKLHIVHLPVRIRVIDPLLGKEEQRVVLTVEQVGKGSYTEDVSRAALMAGENVARKVARELVVRLRDRLADGG